MAIGPTIETDRLILRPPRAEDFDSWVAFHGDAEVMKHLGGVQGPELTWRSMCTMTGAWTIRGFSMFSVIEKATEGASAAIDYAVDILGWDEVIHTIDPANASSIRVAERLGSRVLRQAMAPPPYEGTHWDVYGQSADDWRSRRIKGA